MNKDKDKFEDLFRERFDNFEADVNPGVWKNIQTGLKGVGIGLLLKGIFNKIGSNAIVAVVSGTAAVIGTLAVVNYSSSDKIKAVPAANQKIVVDAPKPQVQEIKEFLAEEKPVVKPASETVAPAKEKVAEKPKKDKQNIAKVINSLSDQTIASISSSTIGGSVPLIVNFNNNGRGTINKWDFGDGNKQSGSNLVHVYDVPGIYTVRLISTSPEGHVSIDSIKLEVTGNSSNPSAAINSFSPNNDGQNDTFFFTSKNIKDMNAEIFDIKGNMVYSQQGIDFKWDGNDMNGKPAKVGVYIFIVNAIGVDGKKYENKGKINLTR